MTRKSLVPIQLPADPTVALEAATKQYVDGKVPGAGTITPAMLANSDFGDFTVASGVGTLDNGVVTNAKLATMAAGTVKGRSIGSAGVPTDLDGYSLSSILNTAYFQRPPFAIGAFSGAAKTLLPGPMGDAGYWTDYTGTGQTITVGPDSGGVHPWGSVYYGSCLNAATIVAGSGVTIRSAAGLTIPAGATWMLINVGVNSWYLSVDSAGGLTQAAADTRYVNVDGDSMTGALIISGNLQATTMNMIDAPTSIGHVTRKDYVDAQRDTRVAKVGDTMTGDLRINSDAGRVAFYKTDGTTFVGNFGVNGGHLFVNAATNAIQVQFMTSGVTRFTVANTALTSTVPVVLPADPSTNLQAATKQYVDGLAAQATLDARYVNVTGDTMTGTLVIQATASPSIKALRSGGIMPRLDFYDSDGTTLIGYVLGSAGSGVQLRGTAGAPSIFLTPITTPRVTVTDTEVTASVPVVLPANPASALEAATKQYVDAGNALFTSTVKGTVPPPTTATGKFLKDDGTWAAAGGSTDVMWVGTSAPSDGATEIWYDTDEVGNDALFVNVTGDTMTGSLYLQTALRATTALRVVQGQVTAGSTADFDLTGAGSVSVPTPTATAHAVTKGYVDGAFSPKRQTVGTTSSTAWSLSTIDENWLWGFTAATAVTVTIPTWATSMPVGVGFRVDFAQLGDGKVTVVGAGGVTILATPSAGFRAKGSAASLVKTAMPDTWLLVGDLA